jgi:kinesin family protein 11
MSSTIGKSQVQVVVRVRPLNEKEKTKSTLPVVSASSTKSEITVIRGAGARQMRHGFKFDQVFSGQSTQEDVFNKTLRPMIDDVLNGFESTVFAYGQVRGGGARFD